MVAKYERRADRVDRVRLATGETVPVGTVVNASGARAALTARMAGLELPVEPRLRYTFMFDAAERLERDLPLTIDPTGVHVRSDGDVYMAGCAPDDDRAFDHDDLRMDRDLWEEKVWPALAHRIPAFERAKVMTQWAGHYAYNTLDHNVVVGPHNEVPNFIFANGFSGRGLQQSPAIGRGVAELITYNEYRTLDLTPLGYDRIARRGPSPKQSSEPRHDDVLGCSGMFWDVLGCSGMFWMFWCSGMFWVFGQRLGDRSPVWMVRVDYSGVDASDLSAMRLGVEQRSALGRSGLNLRIPGVRCSWWPRAWRRRLAGGCPPARWPHLCRSRRTAGRPQPATARWVRRSGRGHANSSS